MLEGQPRKRGQGLLQTPAVPKAQHPRAHHSPPLRGHGAVQRYQATTGVISVSPLPHQQEAEQEELWEDSGRIFSGESCSTKGLSSVQ